MTSHPHEYETAEELRLLRGELARLRRTLADVTSERDGYRFEGDELRHQLQVLRRSGSWRITRPIRTIRRRLLRHGEF